MKFYFMLIGLAWQVAGIAIMFNSHLGEIKHLEGIIAHLVGFIVIAILIEKDER